MKRKMITIAAGLAVATAAAGGVAYAADAAQPAPTDPAAATATTAAAAAPAAGTGTGDAKADGKGKGHHAGIGRHLLHGQFTAERKGGAPVLEDAQRGDVTAVSPTSLTVHSTDGFVATYALSPDTKVWSAGKPAAASEVKQGSQVAVLAADDSGHPAAQLVRLLPAKK